jgi:haloalkane dehalogenase
MNAIRTPDTRFENLPGYNFEPHYFETNGLRIHYVDEGGSTSPGSRAQSRNTNPGADRPTFLCLHGEPSWSYLYRKMVPILAQRGRVLAPDLAGFGKSDKPAEIGDYSVALHLGVLKDFLSATRAKNIVLVCQDWGGLLGLPLAMELESIFSGLVIMNTGLPDPAAISLLNPANWLAGIGFLAWRTFAIVHPDMPVGNIVSAGSWPPLQLPSEIVAAYDAPFPDKSYKAGADAFPRLVPLRENHPSLPYMRRAREKIQRSQLRKLVMFSNRDPVTWSQREYFAKLPVVLADIEIRNAGHFLQEDKGEELAENILKFF